MENYLAEAEDAIRADGYELPIAWALGFLLNNDLVSILTPSHPDLAYQVEDIVDEIREAYRETQNTDS